MLKRSRIVMSHAWTDQYFMFQRSQPRQALQSLPCPAFLCLCAHLPSCSQKELDEAKSRAAKAEAEHSAAAQDAAAAHKAWETANSEKTKLAEERDKAAQVCKQSLLSTRVVKQSRSSFNNDHQ